MSKLHLNMAYPLLVLAILVLVAIFPGITATAKTTPQDDNWTAHPFHYASPALASGPGYYPAQIINAYRLALSTNGNGTTIAIVDAYDDPTIASDLAAFSSYCQLPDADFIIHKMAPSIIVDGEWAREISLDVEWAHAIAPLATILLVEANSSYLSDLLPAVNYATSYPGVVAVSMSWGGNEFSSETYYDSYFTKPGIVFFASSGDNGAGATWPSSSPNVVSVGGTTLSLDANDAVISETAWSGSGGGVSSYEQQPVYQKNYGLTYTKRSTPDVSYDADPNPGMIVYDTTPYQGYSGWWNIGGTSAGAPQWAAIHALELTTGNSNFYLDAKQSASSYFRDITSGSNGNPAAPGYDLVTGLGSPITTNFTPIFNVPSAPQSLSATGYDGYVRLTWNAPISDGGSSITGYNVYRGTISGGETLLTTLGNVLTYTNTGLTNGQNYYYTVRAVNGVGEGAMSNEASATPATVPTAPTLISAMPSNSQVVLTWTMPSSNGGSSITGYNVYRGTSSGGETLLATLGSVFTYTSTGLTNGQTYYYKVSALNSVGEGAQSNELSAIPVTIPANPILMSATPGNAQVVLTWTAPNNNGGSPITNYNVYRGTTSGGEVFLFTLGNVLTNTNTGLTNGQIYYYKVTAVNSVGEGPPSNEVSATPATVPGTPQSLSLDPGNAQVILTWSIPTSNGGSTITGYKVYRSTTETGTFSLVASPSGTTYTDSSLSNGQTYWYEVSAVNAVGEGAMTSSISATPYTVPNAPTGLTAIANDSQVTLNWTAPSFNGGRAIDYYVIYQDGVALLNNPSRLTTIITGLTNGQSYSFTVAAHNIAGIGAQSIGSLVTPFTVPNNPQSLTITPGNAQVTLSWAAPAFNGGRAITNYNIYRSTSSSGEILLIELGNVLTYTDASLTNGQPYYYKVSAVNLAGVGPQSDEVTATPYTVPNPPTGITAIAGNAQVALNWTAPIFNGGRAIDYYIVYQDGVAISNHSTTLSTTITGLRNGQSYLFAIAAHNLAGVGAQSLANSSIPYTVPNAPTGLTAIPGRSQVTLNWTSPTFDGGRVIFAYNIYRSTNVTGPYLLITSPSSTNYTDISLTNGQTYWYYVGAVNVAGEGLNTSTISSTPFTVPNAPTGFVAIPGNAQVMLNWTTPAFDGGRPIDYYVIYQDGIALSDLRTDVITNITRVINGQNYSFTIAAHNLAGLGSQSIVASAIPFTTPNAPTGLQAVPGNAQVTLNWTAPGFNGGRTIDYYIVYQEGLDVSHSTTTTALITNLNNGQGYNFTVTAHNAAGNGTQSYSAAAMPVTVPGAPTEVTATPGIKKVTIAWQAPVSTGGSPIIWYTVYRDSIPFIDVNASTMECVDPTGIVGTPYTYCVVATNAVGNGPGSLPVSASPQADNTMLYIGIGAVAILAVAGAAIVIMRRRK